MSNEHTIDRLPRVNFLVAVTTLFLFNLGLSLNLSHTLPNLQPKGFAHWRSNCVAKLAMLVKNASVELEAIREPLRSENE